MTPSAANFTFRRATGADVPRFAELITAASLPPLFIEEYLDGFVAAERDGVVLACGGVEFYDRFAVIRSVVVDPAAQGLGVGRKIAQMLIDAAGRVGSTDVYLFTADALTFWQVMGFEEIGLADWHDEPRACWQYQFISQIPELAKEVRTMRRTL